MNFPSNYSLEEIERILYLQNDLTCDNPEDGAEPSIRQLLKDYDARS